MTFGLLPAIMWEAYDSGMKLDQFLAQSRAKGGTSVPSEVEPLLVILTRVGMNRHSVESQALIRASLAVIAQDGNLAESDLWALGSDARGLLNAFADRRQSPTYDQVYLDTLGRRIAECRQNYGDA
jgi:hypothetical protein